MTEYRLKTPKQLEQKVVGAYKKIEGAVVESYKKVEDRFVDTFLERVEKPEEYPPSCPSTGE